MPFRVLLNTRQNSSCFKLLLFFTERGVTITLRILLLPWNKPRNVPKGGRGAHVTQGLPTHRECRILVYIGGQVYRNAPVGKLHYKLAKVVSSTELLILGN